MKDIHILIDEITDEIKKDEARKRLEIANEKMENSNEVIMLSISFSKAQNELSTALNHFDENSDEVKEKEHELFIAKKNLDSHPLVMEYYKALQEVNEPLHYLEYNLFNVIGKMKKNKCD